MRWKVLGKNFIKVKICILEKNKGCLFLNKIFLFRLVIGFYLDLSIL